MTTVYIAWTHLPYSSCRVLSHTAYSRNISCMLIRCHFVMASSVMGTGAHTLPQMLLQIWDKFSFGRCCKQKCTNPKPYPTQALTLNAFPLWGVISGREYLKDCFKSDTGLLLPARLFLDYFISPKMHVIQHTPRKYPQRSPRRYPRIYSSRDTSEDTPIDTRDTTGDTPQRYRQRYPRDTVTGDTPQRYPRIYSIGYTPEDTLRRYPNILLEIPP